MTADSGVCGRMGSIPIQRARRRKASGVDRDRAFEAGLFLLFLRFSGHPLSCLVGDEWTDQINAPALPACFCACCPALSAARRQALSTNLRLVRLSHRLAALNPPFVKAAYKFLDFDGDGDTDIPYHPAGVGTTAAAVLSERSGTAFALARNGRSACSGIGVRHGRNTHQEPRPCSHFETTSYDDWEYECHDCGLFTAMRSARTH